VTTELQKHAVARATLRVDAALHHVDAFVDGGDVVERCPCSPTNGPKGLRAEQIRAELGIAKREWMRPLGLALDSKKLTKKGSKRATTYFSR
jgi:hypothetical protein